MTKRIVMDKSMAHAILGHLGQYAALPNEGILAGQAVCSAILDLFGEGGGVYNDIDIFIGADESKKAELEANREEEALALGMSVASFDEYDGVSLMNDTNYTIDGTTRDGLLNYVWCTLPTRRSKLTPTRVLMSFDINCVEVALDLATGKLYWTPAFASFAQNRQLEFTSLETPGRSILRYSKKRTELAGVYGDDQLNLELIALVTWFLARQGSSTSQSFRDMRVGPSLTPKHAELFRETVSLHEWFRLGDVESERFPLMLNREPSAALRKAFQSDFDRCGTAKLATLFYRKQLTPPTDLDEIQNSFERMFSACDLLSESFQVFGLDFVKGNHSDRHVELISQTVAAHEQLVVPFFGLTLDQQYRAVEYLRKLAKNKGEWVFGLIESRAVPYDLMCVENIDDFFATYDVTGEGRLTEPLFEPIEYKDWVVQELVTWKDLTKEGADLAHCVGGYALSVGDGDSRIISIRKGDDRKQWSTVELDGLNLENNKEIRIVQHRATKNTTPTVKNQRALHLLLRFLAKRDGLTYERPTKGRYDFDLPW